MTDNDAAGDMVTRNHHAGTSNNEKIKEDPRSVLGPYRPSPIQKLWGSIVYWAPNDIDPRATCAF